MRKRLRIPVLFLAVFACHAAQPTAESIDTLLKLTRVESLMEKALADAGVGKPARR